ncbi:MAG: hypothetical protein EZS28_051067 [Streblomastix strix]|uniref:Uncharacterized protein n=1 Tax=Streblomastix strix TaxID=222440 RepID=A0A5J4T4S5_9EUKA|nr:MAG: hypothetical protein EZS28_051067 [Streblomastix strix]
MFIVCETYWREAPWKAPYPVDKDQRFDVGISTSGSVYNYKSVQEIRSNASPLTQEDKSKLPNKFYRIGTDLSWSNKGGYGFTDETSEQLLAHAPSVTINTSYG